MTRDNNLSIEIEKLLKQLFCKNREPYILLRDEGTVRGWKLTMQGYYGPAIAKDYAVSYYIPLDAAVMIEQRLSERGLSLADVDPNDEHSMSIFEGLNWKVDDAPAKALKILGPEEIDRIIEMLQQGCTPDVNYLRINYGDAYDDLEDCIAELIRDYPLVTWNELMAEDRQNWVDRLTEETSGNV